MSKGLYIRRLYRDDTCEYGHKAGSKRYPCGQRAKYLVEYKGEVWKYCNKHKIATIGKVTNECCNCGCRAVERWFKDDHKRIGERKTRKEKRT